MTYLPQLEEPISRSAPSTVGQRVLQMRDDFLLLVKALNDAHEFHVAMHAQGIVIALDKFEGDHDVTKAKWPPEHDAEDGGLKWVVQ